MRNKVRNDNLPESGVQCLQTVKGKPVCQRKHGT